VHLPTKTIAKHMKIICNVSAKYCIAHWPKCFVDMADDYRISPQQIIASAGISYR
jgi:hypothetical protein